jgi:SAM-dependent methyltransferase
MERTIARAYALTYHGIVNGFPPYERLLDEIAALVARSRPADATTGRLKVLDVSCGIGTVAVRLARDGHSVVGLDGVERLVTAARERTRGDDSIDVSFHHMDLVDGPIPGAGTYDVVVSMHTLYWHPNPTAVLAACRRAIRPGGHAVFLTYARQARVRRIFAEIRRTEGVGAATQALRWLVPTALFERFRDCDHLYLDEAAFHARLRAADFDVLESHRAFLAGISLIAWGRRR